MSRQATNLHYHLPPLRCAAGRGVDHCGLPILVVPQLLHGAHIIASLTHMCGEAMAKRAAGDVLLDNGLLRRPPDGFLQPAFVLMIAHHPNDA
ncbi:MAG: hypothetical protein KatS3mg054_1376 [Chloroflexus sp.]|nr:MAG: hypothetical protein KatS3mg054_1376 [Chloroflexus sp.]